ncbi:MAG: fibronectin type III domain-containing protein [Actinomycetes bacterium]
MANAVATIGLTYRGTDVQEAFNGSAAIFLEIVRGLNEHPSVRGMDLTVPGRVGRIQGTRVKDMRLVELRGIVMGATGATELTTFRTKVLAFQTLFDPTLSGSLIATLEDGSTLTLTNVRTLNLVWDEIAPAFARVSVELETSSPNWTTGAALPGHTGTMTATGGGVYTQVATHTTPPTISNVVVSAITQTSANIAWNLSAAATGQVDFGPTLAYGQSTVAEESFSYTNHTQPLTGLVANTLYYYRIRSQTAAGATATYTGTFTTSATTGVYPANTTLTYIAHSAVAFPTLNAEVLNATLNTYTRRIGNVRGQRNVYAKTQAWNSDGTVLALLYPGTPVFLNGTTYAYIKDATGTPGYAQWSSTNPDLMYGTYDDDTRLIKYSYATRSQSTEHDFGVNVSFGAGEGTLSDNDRIAIMNIAGTTAWVYDIPTHSVLCSFSTGGNADNVNISHDGNFVLADFAGANDGTGPGKGLWVWDAANGSNGRQLATVSRHFDTCVGQDGRQKVVTCSPGPIMRDLVDGTSTNLAIPYTNAFQNGHVSGRANQRPGWAYFSDYLGTGTNPGMDQICAVKLDSSGTVEIFAFSEHFTGNSYDDSPFAVPNRNGTVVLWGSDYNQGAGGAYPFIAHA